MMLATSLWAETNLWSAKGRYNSIGNTKIKTRKFIALGRLAVASTSLCLAWGGAT
ncbi:hypothetical protein BDR03DRAFT_950379 [Suillus americanus]|nr:hypothetical protein BDR03DRAFT_950379 [Suillus americanus]